MTTTNLLWFAAVIGVVLLTLLWRLIRAEDGHGFMPVSQDTALMLASAFFGAISLTCFAFDFSMLLTA